MPIPFSLVCICTRKKVSVPGFPMFAKDQLRPQLNPRPPGGASMSLKPTNYPQWTPPKGGGADLWKLLLNMAPLRGPRGPKEERPFFFFSYDHWSALGSSKINGGRIWPGITGTLPKRTSFGILPPA